MSDDLSDDSFDSSSFGAKDEAPTLDETIFDVNLYSLFLNYMKSHQQAGNLMFLKDARNFRMFNQPRNVIIAQASKLIMLYFTSAAPFSVSVSEEVKKQMVDYAFDPVSELKIDQNTFAVAFGEVYNAVFPHYRNWISTNEWREAVPFHRIPPPTFNIVLTSSSLRTIFNKYLKNEVERARDDSAPRAFHLWEFCLLVNDFREGKCTQLKKKKKKGESESSESASDDAEEKKLKPEEYAKRLYKSYKHYISLPYDGTLPYAVFIVRALDRAAEEFDKSSIFARWIELKPYHGVDYQAKTVHQSLTSEGFAEPPTLAASLTSNILPLFMGAVQGSEQGMNLEFLNDIIIFHRKFEKFDLEKKSTTSSSGSQNSSGETRADMIEEGKRIFNKFLDKGEMYCDPTLVEEVRAVVTKGGGKGIHPEIFRKCGAFIYHRSEHTWCREARATFAWVGMSYDNRSKKALSVEQEFSMSVLPPDFDLQICPSIDDILENPPLSKDYFGFINQKTGNLGDMFADTFTMYMKTPVAERRPLLEKIVAIFAGAGKAVPQLAPLSNMISAETAHRERITDTVLYSLLVAVVRDAASRYYKNWLIEHSNVWKTERWTPVSAVRCGDLKLLVGMSAVESKIEEEALKGKSGFSRYLAKRQLKKQAAHNIHTTTAADLSKQTSGVLSTSTTIGNNKVDAPVSHEKANGIALFVPDLQFTLSSVYLRELFGRITLGSVLSTSEITLWEGLCEFFKKYQVLDNEKLGEAQDEIRKEALEICDKYKVLIPDSAKVEEYVKKQKILFPHLFRKLEQELYGKHYAEFEAVLRKNGWK